MHRLTDRLRRRLRGDRDRDRGASAVLVGLLIVPVLAFAALAVDVAAMHADKQMLQTGADAAALAVAQDCAHGECGDEDATAVEMATANNPFGGPAGAVVTVDTTAGLVTVRTESSRNHFFAPVLGADEAELAAVATARWGYPSAGAGVLPFILGVCEILAQVPGLVPVEDDDGNIVRIEFPEDADPVTIWFSKDSDSAGDCYGPSGNAYPGGFGWLLVNGSCDGPVVEAGDLVSGKPEFAPPQPECDDAYFEALIGETVLVPIFDFATDAGGANGKYNVLGFAAFTLMAYDFKNGEFKGPGNGVPGLCLGGGGDGGANACLQGTFERFVDSTGEYDLDPDAPELGAAIVELILTEN